MKYAVFDILKSKKTWIISFLAGLSIGVIYANVKWFGCTEEINTYISYWNERISNSNIDQSDFQKYIFEYRIRELLMIFVFNLTVAGKLFNCCYLGYCGYSSALVESILTLKYGYKGMGMYAVSIFPHYIVYVAVLLYTLSRCEKVNRVFFKDKNVIFRENIGVNEIKNIVFHILVIILMAWVESVMESYINIHIFV